MCMCCPATAFASLRTHSVFVDNGRQPCVEDLAQLRVLRPARRVLFNFLLLRIPESLASLKTRFRIAVG